MWQLLAIAIAVAIPLWMLFTPRKYAPGPVIFPFIGSPQTWIQEVLRGDGVESVRVNRAKYGSIYQSMVPALLPQYEFTITDPKLMKFVLGNSAAFPERGIITFNKMAPKGLLALPSSEKWQSHRSIITPILTHKDFLNQFVHLINSVASKMLTKLDKHSGPGADARDSAPAPAPRTAKPVEINAVLTAAAFDVISEAGFGFQPNSLDNPNSKFSYALKMVFQQAVVFELFPTFLLDLVGFTKAFDKTLKSLKDLAEVARSSSSTAKSSSPAPATEPPTIAYAATADADADAGAGAVAAKLSRENIISLLEQEAQDNKDFAKEDIVDETITLMVAGHETTAHTLSWTVKLLAENPKAQDRAYEEVLKVLGHDRDPSFEMVQASSFPYLEAVILEALRLYPTVPMFVRNCVKDISYEGHYFPAGSSIGLAVVGCNMSEEFWESPRDFIPDRFLDLTPAQEAKLRSDRGFYPFGGGKRMCIGKRFAMTEAIVILARILQRFQLSLAPSAPTSRGKAFVTLFPENGVHVNCVPRKDKVPDL